jgi:flagellar basal-body rod protein FlgB
VSWLHTPEMALLERFLDLSATRQTLVSTNLANVDTPGYHTRDIDFRGELQRAMDGFNLAVSNPAVRQVRGLLARPDGNNVSVDRESLLLAQVQLQFKAATAILRAEFARLNNAIKEGQA